MSVFGGLEDNAPDGSLYLDPHLNDADNANAAAWGAAPAEDADDSATAPPQESRTQESKDKALPHTDAPISTRRARKRLTITVTAIEHTKTELIVWFDVQTSLPRFRSSYRDVRRTHNEMRRFADHLIGAYPECFVPALPGPTNSFPAASVEHDERLRQVLQRWFDRVCSSPLLARDEEFLYFVEASFGYAPVAKVKATPTGLARKMMKQFAPPPDDVDELRELRPRAKLLYTFALESQARLACTAKSRRALAADLHAFGTSLQQFATGDDGMSHMWTRVGKAVLVTGEAESSKGMLAEATYGDTIEVAGRDAYIVKETLTNRHLVMRDLLKAQAATRDKHQRANRLQGTDAISAAKVDEAKAQLDDAEKLEKRITSAVRVVDQSLLSEKGLMLARVEADILEAIGSCALRFIDQERRTLAAWESARPDVRAADRNGGLSHLGRDVVSSPRRNRHSQGWLSDDWSDRAGRAKDIAALAPPSGSESEVLDKKSAASILAESIF